MTEPKYALTEEVYRMVVVLSDGGSEGTGIRKLVAFTKNVVGNKVPSIVIDYAVTLQINLLGDYPLRKDIAPSIIFAVVFLVLALAHLGIFLMNYSRGHYFFLSIGWVFYCGCRVIGFALRAQWATDLSQVDTGLTSELFLIIPTIMVVSFNLILAQRLFTWRHPVGGSRRLFLYTMIVIYLFVVILVGVTILGAFTPYINYLSKSAYDSYKHVVQSVSILIILYSLTSISLLGLSYWSPTKKDENLYTYQPWWIESFSPFYYVRKGAPQEAAETFMKRNHNHRHAVRVIAATMHHHNMVEGLSNQRGDLKHNFSIILLCVSTLFIFVGSIIRAITNFQARQQRYQSDLCNPVAMYILWGLLEVIINLMYLIGRADLRFYQPDILPKKVRNIITADQTNYQSEDEDTEDKNYYDEYDHEHHQDPEKYSFRLQDDGSMSDDWNFVDVDVPTDDEASRHENRSIVKPPYPVSKHGDDHSEFNF